MITVASFRSRFREFADEDLYPSDALDPAIQEAVAMVNRDHFGEFADNATLYLAAHIAAATVPRAGSSGPTDREVESVTAGGVSVTYASGGGSGSTALADDLDSSPYGVRYKSLCRMFGGPRAVV